MTQKITQDVPLTPNINLMKNPNLLKGEFLKLHKFFEKHKIDWYIQSSFATHFYGVTSRKVTDIDIRVNYPIRKLFLIVKREYSQEAWLRPPVRYEHGEFRNECIFIPWNKTHIDIFEEPRTYNKNDNIEFRLPFDKNYRIVNYARVRIPICSLEYLIIYKLINRRSKNERKNDLGEVSQLLEKIKITSSRPS